MMAAETALAFRLALREMRGSISRFRVFLLALALGVAAIAAVGSVAEAMRAGVASNSRSLHGGDLEASSTHTPPAAAVLQAMRQAGTTSSIITMRAMLAGMQQDSTSSEGGGNAETGTPSTRRLVLVRAVDDAWPLIGNVGMTPQQPLDTALAVEDGRPGILADASAMRLLGLEIGDTARLGGVEVILRGILESEPDRSIGFGQLAPHVLISRAGLDATGLNTEGALVTHRVRLLLDNPVAENSARLEALTSRLQQLAEGSQTRIRTHRQAAPGFATFIARTETFLTLVGLTALLIGGLGVASAVRAWLAARMTVIATLKCLGASGPFVFRLYLIQILILAMLGIAIGLGIAILAPPLVRLALAGVLPVPMETGIYPQPLLTAAGFGLLTTLAFAVWPLGQARLVRPAQLFRSLVTPPTGRPQPVYIVICMTSALALAVLTALTTTDIVLAVSFAGGVLASIVLLAGLAELLMRLVRALPIANTSQSEGTAWLPLRLALSAIIRPGNATRSIIISFGLGLAVLVAINVSEKNLNNQLEDRLAVDAPSWFFIDIQPDQIEPVLALLRGATTGDDAVEATPMVRGRVTKLNGRDATSIDPPPDFAWVLRGDRAFTWAALPPPGAEIVSGSWWPEDYDGPLLTSMDAEAMQAFGLKLGDTVSFNIVGREMTATIASSRIIRWEDFGINFLFIMSPGMINRAPHSWIATTRTNDRQTETRVERQIARQFPNISAISVRETVATVSRILELVSAAISVTAGITLIAGFAVLSGTIAASEHRRMHTAIILKVLGASRRLILSAYLVEYALLGMLAALAALLIGSLGSWAVISGFLNMPFVFPPQLAAWTAIGGAAATTCLGLTQAGRTLGRQMRPDSFI